MFMVVSKWQPKPGKEQEFMEKGRAARNEMRQVPGVSLVASFMGENGPIAVIGYDSKEAYDRIVNTPGGPFEQIAQKHDLASTADWVWSERGDCLED